METTPEELPITETKKEEFNTKFGITWAAALEAGSLHNAKGAASKLGTMEGDKLIECPAKEMDKKWQAASDSCLKLAPGLYVANIGDEDTPLYVVNGFYASMRDKYVSGKGIYYFIVGFNPSSTPWSKFRGQIIGATDPTKADPASIRGKMYANWESEVLDLYSAPNMSDNGIHASAGPIEALKERTTWLQYPIKDDPFGKQLLNWTGDDETKLTGWMMDEVVEVKGMGVKGKMFDVTEDRDSAYAIMLCNNLVNQ
jgi:nucleoside diphosphate kinase